MFLDLSPQTRKKSKNKQMGLNKLNKQMGHQTKKLLHSEQNEKSDYTLNLHRAVVNYISVKPEEKIKLN